MVDCMELTVDLLEAIVVGHVADPGLYCHGIGDDAPAVETMLGDQSADLPRYGVVAGAKDHSRR